MSAALATIFSFEKSRKWIIRDGLKGISRERLGRADGERLEEVTGVAHGRADRRVPGPMSTETSSVDTDQAAREASGAHPYGRYLEEFEVGAVYKHWPAKTVTEADDHLFCLITMNHHPLHINDVYAQAVPAGPQRRRRAARLLARARHERLRRLRQGDRQPRHRGAQAPGAGLPRRHAVRASPRCSRSASRARSPTAAPCKVHTRVLNQDGVLVAEFKRLVLVPRREPGARRPPRATSSSAGPSRRSVRASCGVADSSRTVCTRVRACTVPSV